MATPLIDINDVPQAIQLALGPVFLLTGIAGTLNVMTGRLARIIDRARYLTERDQPPPAFTAQAVKAELAALERRRRWAGRAITASTFSALLVCMVIATLFLEVVLDAPLMWAAGVLFTGSTLALVAGLSFFLREVHLASISIRIQVLVGGPGP
jgi:Protein of unknown function (DUF2721)